ncbi:hypothetical protein [Oryza sativa Japonica Group]|nr:hypothetical protein [Oryza sativa Japonica Group]BAD53916.1 hypothetical protein [Oryza sativa Japonica Group]
MPVTAADDGDDGDDGHDLMSLGLSSFDMIRHQAKTFALALVDGIGLIEGAIIGV